MPRPPLAEPDAGPWMAADCSCVRCAHRDVAVAPVAAHAGVALWECPKGGGMTVTHEFYPDADDAQPS